MSKLELIKIKAKSKSVEKSDSDTMKIYCINLLSQTERRQRMQRRFDHHKITPIFIEATDKRSQMFDKWLSDNKLIVSDHKRGELACFLSHLKAIKAFLASGEDYGIICEDDILFHNEFREKYDEIIKNVPDNCNFVGIGYLVLWWQYYGWVGRNPDLHNLRPIIPDTTWGMICYRISRKYAEQITKLFDGLPVEKWIEHTSEIIIKKSSGVLMWPQLVIEEISNSTIRKDSQRDFHIASFTPWGYFNYFNTELYPDSMLMDQHHYQLADIRKNHLGHKRILWVSRLGYQCSYSYVSMIILKEFAKIPEYDIHVFCNGIVYTAADRMRIAAELGIPKRNVWIIEEQIMHVSNLTAEDKLYVNNFFGGLFTLDSVIDKINPNVVICIDDNSCINRQVELLNSNRRFKYIPYLTVDLAHLDKEFIHDSVKYIITMTEFGKKEILKIKPELRVDVLPHIVDDVVFKPLDKKTCRKKYIPKLIDKFIVGAFNANNNRKRWDLLLEGFAIFATTHVDAYLLLKSPYDEPKDQPGLVFCSEYHLTKLVKQIFSRYNLSLDRVVTFFDTYSESELNELYNCCDIGITATSGEGWGLIPCEMAMCKIPQIMPNWSSFMEIFEGSVGLMPVEKYTSYLVRTIGIVPDIAYNQFTTLCKSYKNHNYEVVKLDNLEFTLTIETICISPFGLDNFGPTNYTLPNMNVIHNFKTVRFAAEFLATYNYPDRLQVLISIDPEYLKTESKFIVELYDVLWKHKRINYLITENGLNRIFDPNITGLVAIPKVSTIVDYLEKFYLSKDLRKTEADYQYDRIKKICNKDSIIKSLIKMINDNTY